MSEEAPAPAEPSAAPAPRRRPVWLAALAAMVTLLAMIGLYARQSRESQAADSPAAPAGLFQEDQARGTSLTSVGRVLGLSQPCTAWLLDAGADSSASAYAVTSGRCAGVADSATILTDQPASGATVEFNTFASLTSAKQVDPVAAAVDRIVWASARGTDLAVLGLDSTYGELAAQGVAGIRPAAFPEAGGEILVAGVPVEGIDDDQRHLRGSRCAIGATTDVAEAPWLWTSMRAVDCAGILDGSAGSPAFNPDGSAVGMVTTTTIGAEDGTDCAAGRPCEVAIGSVSLRADTSYLTAVDALAGCFPDGRFTLGADCALEEPTDVVAASLGSSTAQAGAPVQVQVAPTSRAVGARAAMLDEGDCATRLGWAAQPVSQEGAIAVTAPGRQGLALVCVGSASHPTPLFLTIAGTAPDAGAIELDQVPVTGGVEVGPVAAPPEYSTFTWTVGPAGTTDCATAEGYVTFHEPALIEAADLPATVCVIAYDAAGTPSAPTAFTVE